MIDLFEKCAKPSLAAEAKRLGIYPYFHALESKQDVEVIMEGKRRIMLGSNNSLGLTTHPEVIEAGVKATRASMTAAAFPTGKCSASATTTWKIWRRSCKRFRNRLDA